MAFLTAEQIVSTSLGLLIRELTLPRLLTRMSEANFRGAKGDTVSIRLPAYAPARTRALRSGATRVKDSLHERKVDVTLDTDVYKDIGITDEELTLDISDFGAQVLTPALVGIVEGIEQAIADEISDATYEQEISFTSGTDDAWRDLLLVANEHLNNAHVPKAGRVLAVGSSVETELLGTDLFVKANESGDGGSALAEATIGRKGGFTIVSSPRLAVDEAYAFHASAFPFVNMAPIVPAGAPWGESRSFQGLAVRVVRVFDPNEVEDRLVLDSWIGVGTTEDHGRFVDGKFVPVTDPENPETGDAERLVRAVKIVVSGNGG